MGLEDFLVCPAEQIALTLGRVVRLASQSRFLNYDSRFQSLIPSESL